MLAPNWSAPCGRQSFLVRLTLRRPNSPDGESTSTAGNVYEGIGEMLVLSRKKNESIVINDDITIVVVEIRGDKVRLGVEAPKEVPVHRNEVYEAIRRSHTPEASTDQSEATGAAAGE